MSIDFVMIAAFGAGGLIFGIGALALLAAWFPTRRWQRVEARIESLEVTPKAGKYVRMNPVVEARYSYELNGEHYVGRRISVFETRPRIFDGYMPPALQELEAAMILEKTVSIKVDPLHPHRAILLDPPVMAQLVARVVFGAICGGVAVAVTHFDDSLGSVALGWGLASLCLLISLAFRDGWWVLMILNA